MPVGKGKTCFATEPVWYLKNIPIETVNSLDILGVNFTSNVKYDDHVHTRIKKCKRSMYSLSNDGMYHPGLNTTNKVHLFKTICKPTLMYGVD